MAWVDLSHAGLIDQTFTQVIDAQFEPPFTTNMNVFFPAAKLAGNDFSIYSNQGLNWFALTNPSTEDVWPLDAVGHLYSTPGLTVGAGYAIDQKMDDGLPTSGNVQAQWPGAPDGVQPFMGQAPAAPSSSTCYDTTSNHYSMSQNGGAGVSCGLSFRFQ